VKHTNDFGDDLETGRGHVEPFIKRGDQLCADVLSRVREEVVVGAEEDLFLLRGPGAAAVEGQVVYVGFGGVGSGV